MATATPTVPVYPDARSLSIAFAKSLGLDAPRPSTTRFELDVIPQIAENLRLPPNTKRAVYFCQRVFGIVLGE